MFNLGKRFVLEGLSLERRRNGYCDTMVGLSMGIPTKSNSRRSLLMKRSSLATVNDAMLAKASSKNSETFRVFLLLFKPAAFYFLVSFVVVAVAQVPL